MPAINGIVETALYVEDLEKSVAFYQKLFALPILFADKRLCAFNVAGRDVLLLFKKGASLAPAYSPGGMVPPSDASGQIHVAFAISKEDLPAWKETLEQNGIPIESTVAWPRGGESIYFRDPDGHLVELVTPGTWEMY